MGRHGKEMRATPVQSRSITNQIWNLRPKYSLHTSRRLQFMKRKHTRDRLATRWRTKPDSWRSVEIEWMDGQRSAEGQLKMEKFGLWFGRRWSDEAMKPNWTAVYCQWAFWELLGQFTDFCGKTFWFRDSCRARLDPRFFFLRVRRSSSRLRERFGCIWID